MQITDKVYYVGVNDRVKHRFESLWALPMGVSYNAYLVVDEQVALIDTTTWSPTIAAASPSSASITPR